MASFPLLHLHGFADQHYISSCWQHPTRGLVHPMVFIPFAEQTGFVRQLTLWMFEEVARQWRALQPTDGALRVAINLSPLDFSQDDLAGRLLAILAEEQVPSIASAFSNCGLA